MAEEEAAGGEQAGQGSTVGGEARSGQEGGGGAPGLHRGAGRAGKLDSAGCHRAGDG